MTELNIVLVEPQIPPNTGNISRTCAATNTRLHLVKPFGFEISDKTLKRAGLDYWQYLDITYYDNITDFFEKNKGETFYYFTTKAKNIYSEVEYPNKAYLVFGREDKGLDEGILVENPDTCVRLPMEGAIRSINLSNAVAVATYEVLRQWGFPTLKTNGDLTKYNWDD